ncbi:hypothetical protein K443DRAFT_674820 [Laccaria amethystina LaAM-08-1]|uniref:BTB domain-containing protein n=1 Tax=Laccaria amethystina LaAM-08-1 TaxID=1095629 RepID=A0A0C9XVY7_9AGAR|nr:hypothetical protein K443DRAFT_674820 [Laccaria amethystina LaAM-08-1]
MSTSMQNAPETHPRVDATISKDNMYFLEHVVFQVENSLFKVPRHHFSEHSAVFATTFTLPPGNDKPVEGCNENYPFKLQGVKKADFQALLKVLYPLQIPFSYDSISFDEWVSILGLATMWEFSVFRKLAIKEMAAKGMDPVSKVMLGQRYGIPDWFRSGCYSLVTRAVALTVGEAEKIGLVTAIRLYQIRDGSVNGRRQLYDYASYIEKVLKEELKVCHLDEDAQTQPAALL